MSDIRKLLDAGFKLGGSRRMAEKYPHLIVVNDETDYDFYAQNSSQNIAYLMDNGFEQIDCQNRNYWDDLLVSIWKKPDGKIEVLLRSDAILYAAAFENIPADTYYKYLWKSSPLLVGLEKGFLRGFIQTYFNLLFRLTKCEQRLVVSP